MNIYQIELTSKCNGGCSYCPQPTMNREKIHMTKEIFNESLKLLDRNLNHDNPINVELHSFGEAYLLGDDLFWFLDRMKEENLSWLLSVNALLFGNDEYDKRFLSYDGILHISIENGNMSLEDKYQKVNRFLELHREIKSRMKICIISFDAVDFNRIKGNYGKLWYYKHSWSENDNKTDIMCPFIQDNLFCIHSNGNIVSCCFDANDETNYGNIFNPSLEKNKKWRKCETCHAIV